MGGGLLTVFLEEGEGVHAGAYIVELQDQGFALKVLMGLLHFFTGDIEEDGVVQRCIAIEYIYVYYLVTGVGVGVY